MVYGIQTTHIFTVYDIYIVFYVHDFAKPTIEGSEQASTVSVIEEVRGREVAVRALNIRPPGWRVGGAGVAAGDNKISCPFGHHFSSILA